MKFLLDKKKLLDIFFLLLVVIVLEWIFFSKQLDYGFRDVDWLVLYFYKFFGNLSLNHLWESVKELGVYASESYYVGILEYFIGINFVKLHLVTHIFKVFTAVAIYLLVLLVFKRKLLAFITSVIYTISYTHAGVFFQLASGAYFPTIIFMALFLTVYYYSLYGKRVLRWSTLAGILLIVTFLLKPERMYPLVALILSIELFVILFSKSKKDKLIISFKRIILILLPLGLASLFYRTILHYFPLGLSPNQFSITANLKLEAILKGNIHQLLYPFSSFGSIFLYEDYWKVFGQLSFKNLSDFILSLFFGPILRLGIITFILLSIITKKALKPTLLISSFIFVFGLCIYLLSLNWQNIPVSARIHFEPQLIGIPAIFGLYILILGCVFLLEYVKNVDKEFIPLILGPYFAFLFVLLTWLPSDLQLVFMGPQRYLTIPSIGTSLFISGLLVIIFDRLRVIKTTRNFAWMIFLIFIPLFFMNFQVANKFFNDELEFVGLRGTEQNRMKNKFRQVVGKINNQDKSLFYFDETADRVNGYFHEATVVAGFESWIRVNPDGTINYFPEPGMMRTNIQCPENTHQNCMEVLKSGLDTQNGEKGVWYADPIRGNIPHFYKLSNLHAVRFINKDVVNIRDIVLKELNDDLSK